MSRPFLWANPATTTTTASNTTTTRVKWLSLTLTLTPSNPFVFVSLGECDVRGFGCGRVRLRHACGLHSLDPGDGRIRERRHRYGKFNTYIHDGTLSELLVVIIVQSTSACRKLPCRKTRRRHTSVCSEQRWKLSTAPPLRSG